MPMPVGTNIDNSAARFIETARSLRADAAKYVAQCDAGALQLNDLVVGFLQSIGRAKAALTTIKDSAGLGTSIERQFPGKAFDGAAAVSSMITGMQTMIDYIEANAPVDAQNRLLILILRKDGSGLFDQKTITAASPLAAFKTQLVAFRDVFDPS